jgi:hypothetical protein
MMPFNELRLNQTLFDALAKGYPTITPSGMLNWRMIGENFSLWGIPTIGWSITWIGNILTLAFIGFRFKDQQSMRNSEATFLALFAATGLISWHYHIHSAIVLLPFLLILTLKNEIAERWLVAWILFPAVILLSSDLLALIQKMTAWKFYGNYLAFLSGICGLILSGLTTFYAASIANKRSTLES